MSRWHAPALIAGLLAAVLVSVGVGVSLQSNDRAACEKLLADLVTDGTYVGVTSCSLDGSFGFFSYAPLGVPPTSSVVDTTPPGPRVTGVVRFFNDEEGWGVIDAPQTPGGAWVHFSSINADGYRQLDAGEHVTFVVDEHGQDGYDYRAEAVRATQ